jgi:hypothetical protein
MLWKFPGIKRTQYNPDNIPLNLSDDTRYPDWNFIQAHSEYKSRSLMAASACCICYRKLMFQSVSGLYLNTDAFSDRRIDIVLCLVFVWYWFNVLILFMIMMLMIILI